MTDKPEVSPEPTLAKVRELLDEAESHSGSGPDRVALMMIRDILDGTSEGDPVERFRGMWRAKGEGDDEPAQKWTAPPPNRALMAEIQKGYTEPKR